MTKIVKKIRIEKDAGDSLLAGLDKLADAVKVTLGPSGQCVIIEKQLGIPVLTKDGVTVASSIYLEDQFESMGCELVKEAAKQTASLAGDGTTTAIILVQSLLRNALSLGIKKFNPVFLARDLEELTQEATNYIKNVLTQELDSEQKCVAIATIASNNDAELGELIGKAVYQIGSDTPVIMQESHSQSSYAERVEGFSFNSGLRSPFFANIPGRDYWQESNVSVLLMEMPLTVHLQIEKIVDDHIKNNKPLLIICSDCSPIMDSLLAVNATRHDTWAYKLAAVHAPDYGEHRNDILQDIAAVTGATLITADNAGSAQPIRERYLGKISFVRATPKMTVLKNEEVARKVELEKWVRELQTRLEAETDPKQKELLNERIQKLKVGTLTLKIGGNNRYDVKERLFRVEDAVRAAQCAIEAGYVGGGGIALFRTAQHLRKTSKINKDIVEEFCDALCAPFRQLLKNAGMFEEYEQIEEELLAATDPFLGLDLSKAKSGKIVYRNLVQENVIDPTKVVCTALEKASSICSTFLTTAALVGDFTDVEAYNRMVNSLPMLRG